MVEAPLSLQQSLTIPPDHLAACTANNVPVAGNAAANTVNHLDLTGANVAPKPLPAGFTPRGIVAMTFSVLAALAGLAVIGWYGLADMGEASRREEEVRIARVRRSFSMHP